MSMDLKGIEVNRYILQPSTLAPPTVNPDNKCFCRNMKTTKNCTMAGVLDMSSCQEGQFAFQWQHRDLPSKPESNGTTLCSSAVVFFLVALTFDCSPEQEDLSTSLYPTSFMVVQLCENKYWASVPASSTTTPSWM